MCNFSIFISLVTGIFVTSVSGWRSFIIYFLINYWHSTLKEDQVYKQINGKNLLL